MEAVFQRQRVVVVPGLRQLARAEPRATRARVRRAQDGRLPRTGTSGQDRDGAGIGGALQLVVRALLDG